MIIYTLYAFIDPDWEDDALPLGYFLSMREAQQAVHGWLDAELDWEEGPADEQVYADLNDYTQIWITGKAVGAINENIEVFWNRFMASSFVEEVGLVQ